MVGETWAALIACWQATHATDPAIRAAYAAIACDEIQHAELAFAIDAWSHERLSPAARHRVATARGQAIRRLAREHCPTGGLDELGLPDHATSRALVETLRAQVWS
jgi:hypothetical protein